MFRVAIAALLGLGVLLMLACAPKPATPVAPSPERQLTPVTIVVPVSPLSAEEKAWNEVVAAARKEGALTPYSMPLIGDIGLKVSQAFAEKYGIKVDVISAGGAAMAERILTEMRMGQIAADIMDAGTFQISAVKDRGGTISLSDLPVLREKNVWKMDPWIEDPDKHTLVRSLGYLSTAVNTNLVKPQDEPKSFKELTQPKWKGKMITIDPAVGSPHAIVFPSLLRRNLIDLETVRTLGKSGIALTSNAADAPRLLIQGQYPIDLLDAQGSFTTYVGMAGTKLPVKFLAMEEGTVAGATRAMGVIKGGPHPNAAKLFINWVLSREGQDVYVRAERMTPVRSDLPDFTPAFVQFEPKRLIYLTAEELKENTRLFRERWLVKLWAE